MPMMHIEDNKSTDETLLFSSTYNNSTPNLRMPLSEAGTSHWIKLMSTGSNAAFQFACREKILK
jgi:hypothetical protein